MSEDVHDQSSWAQRLRDWETESEQGPAAPAGWDRLATALEEERPRRRFAWWWLGGLVAVFMGGFLLGLNWEKREPVTLVNAFPLPLSPATQIEQTKPTAEKPTLRALDRQEVLSLTDKATVNEQATATLRPTTVIQRGTPTSKQQQMQANEPMELRIITSEFPVSTEQELASEQREEALELPTGQDERFGLSQVIQPVATDSLVSLLVKRQLATPALNSPALGKISGSAISSRWSIGASVEISKIRLRTQVPEGTFRSFSRSESFRVSGGLLLHYRLGGRFGVQSGISRGTEEATYLYRLLRTYTPDDEQPLPDGGGSKSFDLEISSDRAKINSQIEVQRSMGVGLDRPRRILIQAKLDERVRTTTVPLLLTYDQPMGRRFGLRIGAGLAYHHQEVDQQLGAVVLQRQNFRVRNNRILRSEFYQSNSFWTVQLAAGLTYLPSARWQLMLQPQWSSSFSELSTNRDVSTAYQRLSLLGSVNYRF